MLNALRSIKRFKTITILIVIQLSLGIILLNNVLSQSENKINKKLSYTSIFENGDTYLVNIFTPGGLSKEGDMKIKEVSKEIYKLKDEKKVNDTFMFYPHGSWVFQFTQEFRASDKVKDIDPELLDKYCDIIAIDENLFNKFDIKISEGQTFNLDDFNKKGKEDIIPIIIGEDYKGMLKVGDRIPGEVMLLVNGPEYGKANFIDFEVIGFYEKDSLFTIGTKYNVMDSIIFSNGLIIVPDIENIDNFCKTTTLFDFGIFVDMEGKSKEDLRKELEEVIKKVDPENQFEMEIEIYDLNKQIAKANESFLNDIKVDLFLGMVLTLLSLIGITTTVLGEIKGRGKEFGIRLTIGGGLKDLYKQIVAEVLIMVSMSVIIANIALKFVSVYKLTLFKIGINIGFVLLFTLVISLIPLWRIRKYQLVDLLKEEEKWA